MKKIRSWILRFSRKSQGIYVACYFILFILLIFSGALLEFGTKSLVYPVVFERYEGNGIIESVNVEEKQVWFKHFREKNYYSYSFEIGDVNVPVSDEDYYIYDVGWCIFSLPQKPVIKN